jgi:hypothetical protein
MHGSIRHCNGIVGVDWDAFSNTAADQHNHPAK